MDEYEKGGVEYEEGERGKEGRVDARVGGGFREKAKSRREEMVGKK